MSYKRYDEKFKIEALDYRKKHNELTQRECAMNIGIGISTLSRWEKEYREILYKKSFTNSNKHPGDIEEENDHLNYDLWRAETALDILKKIITLL
ncbi:MAG: hypothetical protein ACOYB8_04715 [Eubacteriaceae bacterium]